MFKFWGPGHNSSRSDAIFYPHPRRRRGISSTFRIRKFQSAERGRFELPRPFRAYWFSKPARSTALPPLQFCYPSIFEKRRKDVRFSLRPCRLTVRTALFQGANTGSIPVGVIGIKRDWRAFEETRAVTTIGIWNLSVGMCGPAPDRYRWASTQ